MADTPSYTDEVNKKFKEDFDKILSKDVNDLNEHDKQFLVGRRHLLTKDQYEVFGPAIEETLAKNTAGQESETPTKKTVSK